MLTFSGLYYKRMTIANDASATSWNLTLNNHAPRVFNGTARFKKVNNGLNTNIDS
jgi:hypothetical protein